MKRVLFSAIAFALLMVSVPARAQYYEIANQIPSLLSPALSGGLNYKGYVDFSGTAGIGDNRANFIGISTSQGFRYTSWFFMGVGLGVDVAMSQGHDLLGTEAPQDPYDYYETTKTKVMIPVFTDFRFNLGNESSVSAFIDLKVGAAWLLGSSYLRMENAYLSNETQFYLKPTIGVRIPVNTKNSRQAFNVGISYQLLTSNHNYYWKSGSVTMNNVGVTIGYEW